MCPSRQKTNETRPQRADLNPIENLWDSLHRQIQGCTTRPKSVKELLCLLQAEWKKNTTACHTKTCGKYAPEGSRCNCLSWRIYQLLILHKKFVFLFYHRCPNTYW
ncbi:hypothetical protein CEXT_100731 [Caerostris extrusa]|uniref:Uncharacterized protein n=1 Tax=Caerostris extrusa TaxID=172846 RepID=A0AAV4W8T3_CAEEX|nr:hypothetical protein CEXT_100731 [Caerostris extrusa]